MRCLNRFASLILCALFVGCAGMPRMLTDAQRVVIDRAVIERPVGLDVATYINDLTAPVAIAFENEPNDYVGSIIIAESGIDREPRIIGFRPDGTRFDIYPKSTNPLSQFLGRKDRIYGPIGGMAIRDGEIYVSHRDREGDGVISAFSYDGSRRTVIADLPARGDFGVTDLAFHPTNGRLYFGVGSATNSGVVGIDNWDHGWVRYNKKFCDEPSVDLKLLGYRFDTPNPSGGLLGGNDISVTGPFQPFGVSNRLRISKSTTGKPSAALYSISPGGGDVRVEAHGIRYARGLVFNDFGNLYVTNQGMELRGTRPVKDDPDSVLRIPPGAGTWFGWPDFSADLSPISDARFQPPQEMIARTGYPEVSFLIDHPGSGLIRPDRQTLVRGLFPSLSGASKMDFIEDQPGFEDGKGHLLVALSGDRSPWATGGSKLKGPIGYKVVKLDQDTKQSVDYIYNTTQQPAHLLGKNSPALERPIDVKFGPDGALYILDYGRVEWNSSSPKIKTHTGRVLRVAPAK